MDSCKRGGSRAGSCDLPQHMSGARTLTATANLQSKVLVVLCDGGKHSKQQPALLGTTEN
ncbi:hypothetical protein PENDEC_c020G04142 [Penicillium decumbens]|uniref:Uncharacterized protein n=1 Tax=Penicillium decumbens TaxID=69771 RepID=A0A1V6P6V0_PENDC|nr:hypothetical protein PENDEC_c020G04142 [Penicillium decumbens]